MSYWRAVKQWCMGENDRFGTCFLAMAGNLHALVTTANGAPEVMSDGEIEYADHVMTGFNPLDEKTDVGMTVQAMLDYWLAHGWPGDPTLKPVCYSKLTGPQIAAAIETYGAVCAWCTLPVRDDDEPDLSDDAVRLRSPGKYPHAVLIVDFEPGKLWIVTWGEVREISAAWWIRYGGEQFAVLHPKWRKP